MQDGRARGVVEGLGSRKCTLRYVNREDEVREGDTIVTSGMDRVFPKGLAIGTVTGVSDGGGALFKDVMIAPVVDFSRLEEVLVITSHHANVQKELRAGSEERGGKKKK